MLNSITYLDLDFQRLLDGLDLDNALLFLVQDLDGVLEFNLIHKFG